MASNPGQIPAGGKDKITIIVHTENKGGQTIHKRFRVTTNDPQAKAIDLVVTGKIDALVDITPAWVNVIGYKGDKLSQQVQITPHKDHLFTIKTVKTSRGSKKIHWKLKPLGKEPPQKGYVLTIFCNEKGEGRPGDMILLETDLKEKPTLTIPVSCKFFEKPQSGTEKAAE